jgi:16S rRNA (cytosine1402-N4)-methyltransferase
MTARHSPSPTRSSHIPVLLEEMLTALNVQSHRSYIDGTFGAGGYSRAILNRADCTVHAIDRDSHVIDIAEKLKTEYPNRFVFLRGAFGDMLELLMQAGVKTVDGIVLDIGVSSMQLDEAERGFSFKRSGPLDMRMAQSGITAAELVNNAPEAVLADIIAHYGEERAARRIAKAIVAEREKTPIETTHALAALVAKTIGKGSGKTDPATRTFQALRIYVNDELGELVRALEAAERLLSPGGRLVVVTFHSLEDRIVKRFFQSRTGTAEESISRHVPILTVKSAVQASFEQPVRKAITASDKEAAQNPRARSAKLRWAIRTDAPAMTTSFIPAEEIRHALF